MDKQKFMEKLLSQVSLDEIDFACDLERVLAEQVKYLRAVVTGLAEQERIEKDTLVCELRARIADKEAHISTLREENIDLRMRLTVPAG